MSFEQESGGQAMLSKCFRAACTNRFQFKQESPYGHYCSEACMLQGEQSFANRQGNLAWQSDMMSVDEHRHGPLQADANGQAERQQEA